MEINLNVAVNSWLVFWSTYWVFGICISLYTHFNNIRPIVNGFNVFLTLLMNMFYSLLAVIFLTFLPLRTMTNYNIFIKLFLTYVITDIWFYHIHVFSHHPKLYKKLHKMHHYEFMNKPYALTALYCSWFECIFVNVFSVGLGCVIFQISEPYIYIWFFVVSLNSLLSHSGLVIPFIVDGYHDDHHTVTNKNFGLTPYLDILYGTN